MQNSGNVAEFNADTLESFLSQNQHAFMPGETFGGNEIDQQMLSFQVNEKDQTFAIFYPRAVPDVPASREAKRSRYKLMPYIRMMQPGETSLVLDRPVRREDCERFPKQWSRYQARQANQMDGTPLEAMFPFHPEIVANCKASNILTVEALAGLTDAAMAAFGFGSGEMRERARRYLNSVNNPEGARMAAEVEETNKVRTQLHHAQQQLEQANARMAEMEARLASFISGASIGHLGQLPPAPGAPAAYVAHSAPLGEEIPEEQWDAGAAEGEIVIRGHEPPAGNAETKRGPGRPPKRS